MSPAHDQQWREQTLSTHVKHGRYCAACGQSWECDSYISARGERRAARPWWLRALIAVGLTVGLLGLLAYAVYALMYLGVAP